MIILMTVANVLEYLVNTGLRFCNYTVDMNTVLHQDLIIWEIRSKVNEPPHGSHFV
jgi:hypothetical protein